MSTATHPEQYRNGHFYPLGSDEPSHYYYDGGWYLVAGATVPARGPVIEP